MNTGAAVILSAAVIATGLGALAAAVTTNNFTITKTDWMRPDCRERAAKMAAEKADIERAHRAHVWNNERDEFFKTATGWFEHDCRWGGWFQPSASPKPASPANRMGGI